jgi:leader peptidase (prepilin peptidase) / N-methyltransferase
MTALTAAATLLLVALLVAGSIVDARELRLPDAITLPLIALGLALSASADGWSGLINSALGATAGFVALWALGSLYFKRTGTEGLGLGDAKLLAAAGAWLGPLALAPVVLLAATSALAFVVLAQVAGRALTAKSVVPFGPFLSIGFSGLWGAHLFGWS